MLDIYNFTTEEEFRSRVAAAAIYYDVIAYKTEQNGKKSYSILRNPKKEKSTKLEEIVLYYNI